MKQPAAPQPPVTLWREANTLGSVTGCLPIGQDWTSCHSKPVAAGTSMAIGDASAADMRRRPYLMS
ncbi:hypothetical protein J437_LFUL004183 [Ladona fulva]|uniref:Uncharacterized protein n=1 Tax=Ladona fulva TaxID=123851 RepID=A0A8K0K0Z9_LADFU|nr:hypothetical protein J437_LFUL004183 [Ladona fulva]